MRSCLLFLSLAFSTGVVADAAVDQQALTREGLALIPPFQQQLLQTVTAAMQQGGPLAAVQACQMQAPQIAAQHSQAPWKVGRTALKVRNPANAPDAWERQVLQDFAARAAAGEKLDGMLHAEVVGNEFRLLKAIPTGQPCLTCHGEKLDPELLDLLAQRYPADAARGFTLGELLGAFSLRRPLAVQP